MNLVSQYAPNQTVIETNDSIYSKYNLSKKDIVNALEHSWLIGMNISKDNPQAHYEKA